MEPEQVDTIVPDEELCHLCLNQVVTERARAEMGLEPRAIKLCQPCGAKEHVLLRQRWNFMKAAGEWHVLVREAAKREGVRVPIRILLPNGTVVDSYAEMNTMADAYSLRPDRGARFHAMDLRPHRIVVMDPPEANSLLRPRSTDDVSTRYP